MADIHLLRDLQAIDTDLLTHKKDLNEVLRELKGPADLQRARTAVEQAAEKLTAATVRQTDAQLEIDGLKEKLNTSNARLYSGEVTNPRELSDMQMEVESIERRVTALEAKMMEITSKLNSAQRNKDDADVRLAEMEEQWAIRLADLNKRKLSLAMSLKEMQGTRKAQMARIPADIYKRYEKILVQNKGLAVVQLRRGEMCGGCSTTIAQSTLSKIRAGGVVTCPHCGRIVHP